MRVSPTIPRFCATSPSSTARPGSAARRAKGHRVSHPDPRATRPLDQATGSKVPLASSRRWSTPSEIAKNGPLARLCLSVDPRTGVEDGPYVLIGWTEYTLDEAAGLGGALIAMARAGRDATRP